MRANAHYFMVTLIGIGVTASWSALLAAEVQTKTIRLPNKGTRVIKTKQLQGNEILEYFLAGVPSKKVKGEYIVSMIEEFDRDGRFAGANGTFLYRLTDRGFAVKTYDAPPNKVSKRGTGTRHPPGEKPVLTRRFSETDSDQMDVIDQAIQSLNIELPDEAKITTNGFLIFMVLEDTHDVPVAKALAAAADRAKHISTKDTAQRIRTAPKEKATEMFLEMLFNATDK